jgi:hypothetical protein
MAITHITITDTPEAGEGMVTSSISYDVPEDVAPDSPITSAMLHGYVIHYLIKTGKINDYLDEVIAELNALEDQSND